jgi:hypothetical protein
VGSQLPALWHWSGGAQTTGVPVHAPALHASPWMQRFPSLHVVPSLTATVEHAPVFGSQLPAWQRPGAGHCTGFEPTQSPLLHAWVCRHASPSLHVAPSLLFDVVH